MSDLRSLEAHREERKTHRRRRIYFVRPLSFQLLCCRLQLEDEVVSRSSVGRANRRRHRQSSVSFHGGSRNHIAFHSISLTFFFSGEEQMKSLETRVAGHGETTDYYGLARFGSGSATSLSRQARFFAGHEITGPNPP